MYIDKVSVLGCLGLARQPFKVSLFFNRIEATIAGAEIQAGQRNSGVLQ